MHGDQNNSENWEELLSKVAASDHLAFKKIYTYYFLRLNAFASAILKDEEKAKEITNDVFVKFWKNRSTAATIKNLKIYLYIAVKNTCLNYISRTTATQSISSFDLLQIEVKDTHTPEELLLTNELYKKIRQTVDNLPQRCKLVFKLIKEEGLKYREAAEVLNVSPKTIEAQIAFALDKIKSSLKLEGYSFSNRNMHKKNQA